MNFENRIQKYNSLLTGNDHKIIKYLIANKDTVIDKTIIDLSEEIQVSPASITRFCQKVDFDSFQQMKYSLVKNNRVDQNKTGESFEIIYHYYETILKSTQQFITEEQTSRIVEQIINANDILFCGVGNSGLIANEFNSRIERMGISSRATTDPHGMLMKSALLKEDDLLICFSNSGQTKCVIDSARLAKDKHATVIIVTNYRDTELTELADEIVLISSYKYIDDEKFINTQLPSLFFLDLLTYKLLNNEELMKSRKKTLKAINLYG
ncbi:SIS domain-containing protein [Oceanobacillus sp. 143]|uniref:MurR/RpiR family transcriptional regulator n=1 Tax=Oceanobacillus zhaokaii TaxID=2052660 RepID=A0A345PKL2_9BACI|nr:MurR/RpiR family transcriptional regulator [Oceanobacillus zhaokaii]AXI10542.1 MurR/RpiR family transcriptional regulator [Oceanobacillus zhaokaii]QGS69523.1 SIS domain-containing protein [Oceanobacillus sp. 143]